VRPKIHWKLDVRLLQLNILIVTLFDSEAFSSIKSPLLAVLKELNLRKEIAELIQSANLQNLADTKDSDREATNLAPSRIKEASNAELDEINMSGWNDLSH
jgi:hypothetical protein